MMGKMTFGQLKILKTINKAYRLIGTITHLTLETDKDFLRIFANE